MNYSIQVNAVNNAEKSVKAFASVTFGGCFKITNIAIVKGKDDKVFVSMPSFKSKERTEHNEPIYKDVCNPITSDFRKLLYNDILSLYAEMVKRGKTEIGEETQEMDEPSFRVAVTPFERDGSNIRGLARIYFEDVFVVSNVSIIQGKDSEFVAMPSYLVKRNSEDGKSQYQDVCYPVTKEFREKLYAAVMDRYRAEKEKQNQRGRERTETDVTGQTEDRHKDRDLPFR